MDYALIKNGKIINVIVADEAFIEEYKKNSDWDFILQVDHEVKPTPWIGWSYIDGIYSTPIEESNNEEI